MKIRAVFSFRTKKTYPKSTPRLLCPLSSSHKPFAPSETDSDGSVMTRQNHNCPDIYHSKKHKKPSVTPRLRRYFCPPKVCVRPTFPDAPVSVTPSATANSTLTHPKKCAHLTSSTVKWMSECVQHPDKTVNTLSLNGGQRCPIVQLSVMTPVSSDTLLTFLNVEQVRVSQNKQDESHGNRPFIKEKTDLMRGTVISLWPTHTYCHKKCSTVVILSKHRPR